MTRVRRRRSARAGAIPPLHVARPEGRVGREPPRPRPAGVGQGHAGEADRRRPRRSRTSRPATCSAPRSPQRTPLGTRGRGRSSTAGELVPDELTIALIEERLGPARRGAGVRARRLPAHPRAGGGARRACSPGIGRALDAVLFFDLSDELATERMLGRAAAGGPRGRHARGDRDAGSRSTTSRPSRSSSTTAPPARSCRCTRSAPIDEVHGEIPDALDAARRADMIIRKGASGDRADRARGRARRRDDRARRRADRAGDHDGRARRHRRGVHPRGRAASSTSRGYRGYPGRDLHLARTRSSCTGSPGGYVVAEGDLVTIDVGATLDGAIADSAYTFARRRDRAGGPAAARRLPGGARGRHRAGARREPDRRHLARRAGRSSRTPASRSSGASSGTASAVTTTRIPHVPNFGEPGRGPKLSEGMTIAIEPMITIGQARGRGSTRTAGRSRRRTARSPRTSSTRSRSCPAARGS